MLSHLQQNYKFYLLAIIYFIIGYFDVYWQNKFITGYYRLPYFSLAILTSLLIYTYAYRKAQLCPTQSANYRKLALITIGYSIYEIVMFFAKRDPGKGQLLIFTIILLLALLFYFHRDSRLYLDTNSKDYQLAYQKENKFIKWLTLPASIAIFVVQIIFTFYVSAYFQVFYNPLLQIALGFAMSTATMILINTRLDILKLVLIVGETTFLALGFIYFLIILIWQYNLLDATTKVSIPQILTFVVTIGAICLCNLAISLLKTWKGWLGFIFKLTSIVCYFNFFFISYNIAYY